MVWLAKLFSSRYTWILIGAAASAVAVWNAIDNAYERGVADEKARQLAAMTKAMGDMRKRHERELKTRGWQDKSEADQMRVINIDLQNRLAEIAARPPKTLIQTVVKHDESGCSCPTVSLGPDFWMSYRAAGARGSGAADAAPAGPVPGQM